ncbi:glycoside hydrolase/phage tail family protein [Rhizobium sp. TRM95796]|uniref:baseplate multidomain protein megatron n=1 Tax=Rhizobium sp. TRM95796 TaxID=2979862 RepID=UPI0021E95AD2|nr:glycoside hydrolase/phage tail family protein [Rhizobium sp. TRM95796]MCV3765603.1 glycoside hydrolase/phage tail family protein [Rhizobium sp. TRM95796]
MATLVLQAAGAALGGVFGPVGAIIGRAAGALAGNVIDRSLISGLTTIEGSRLANARIAGAEEGTAIPRVYGTMRIGGTLIWATRFEEEVSKERSGSKATGPRVETYRYFANIAVGLAEGPIAAIRRIWADGMEIDQTDYEIRFYEGTESQGPDPLIEAKQGAGNAPAFRGLAYVVFERMPLDAFGNRIPVLQFEVLRVVDPLESRIRAVTIIPGATEHGYATEVVTEKTGEDRGRKINRNQLRRATDWEASLDELQALCPHLERAALVVSWFGSDLRAGHCRVRPGVETRVRHEEDPAWRVCGRDRVSAHLISSSSGGPAYGGTPDDRSVIQAIRDLKARGLGVYLYPFLMMDIPPGNGLPDPYGWGEQAAFPWRGRITCHPAAGRPDSADRTVEGAAQALAFMGEADAGDFEVDGESVRHESADEGYRRLVLHYALLAQAAGGVDGFIIGSELRGLTQIRDASGNYPFVAALVELAEDVRAILGPSTKLTYGADWSEYFGHQPQDGTGDRLFHLDPLWASPAIDAVGIDNYMPLSDFQDEDLTHAHPDGAVIADDEAAMRAAIASGEGYDWYYASSVDRASRIRSPISDGLAGKPWVYRYKDIENWWAHRHHDRVGGAELTAPTGWTARMKPIWFTELGCPAIDRGGNQPNVFVDPKSSESETPYFSSGVRSDETPRRFLNAHLSHWNGSGAPDGMVDPGHVFLWTWDARAAPSFPEDPDIFADGENWRTGHWLNGRLGAGTLATVIAAIARDCEIGEVDVAAVSGNLQGYVMGQQSSARTLIEPLLTAYRLDVTEAAGRLTFRSRDLASAPAAVIDVLAETEDEPLWSETLGQDGDYASEAILTYQAEDNEHEPASVRSRRAEPAHQRALSISLAGTLDEQAAQATVDAMLRDHRLGRRQIGFRLSPLALAHEPGDVVELADGPEGRFLITRIEDGDVRRVTAREAGSGGESLATTVRARRQPRGGAANAVYRPLVALMDLPRLGDGEDQDFAMAAVAASPWRRTRMSVSSGADNYEGRLTLSRRASLGRLTTALGAGPTAVIDHANTVTVRMTSGAVESVSRSALLNGANRAAIAAGNGGWEIIAFQSAEEIEADVWRLHGLLRGLCGTDDALAAGAESGARFVLLDDAVRSLGLKGTEAGLTLNWIAEAAGAAGGRVGPYVFSGGERAATPLAPVHLRGWREPDGDIRFKWIRRGRIDADGWDGDDIPLDEVREAYRLDIVRHGEVVRSLHVNDPEALYAADDEIADFGAPQTALTIRVRQRGARVAAGLPAHATLPI